jgi:hypothetical protein
VTHPGEAGGQFADSPAGGVDLVVVRVVDDFPLRDELGGGLSELQQQRGGQREVAAGEDPSVLRLGGSVDLRIVLLGQA